MFTRYQFAEKSQVSHCAKKTRLINNKEPEGHRVYKPHSKTGNDAENMAF